MPTLKHTINDLGLQKHTFKKAEKLCSKKITEDLFGEESKKISSFPLRVIFKLYPTDILPNSQVLISVSKRKFKHAVERNRTKRQIREIWRQYLPFSALPIHKGKSIAVAIIWLSNDLQSTKFIAAKFKNIIEKMQKKLAEE